MLGRFDSLLQAGSQEQEAVSKHFEERGQAALSDFFSPSAIQF